jgi:hypothetical protein
MKVRALEYTSLTKDELDRINQKTKDLSLNDQLWYIALLADSKVKVFVFNDFETILFIPYRKKFLITYAYMPFFLQKLSFIGSEKGQNPIIEKLLKAVRFGEISMFNSTESIPFDFSRIRKNFTLQLNKSYLDLRKKYSENHRRNLAKTDKIKIEITEEIEPLIAIFIDEKSSVFHKKELRSFVENIHKLFKHPKLKDNLLIVSASDSNQIIASSLFIKFNNVIYYILGTSIKSSQHVSSKGLFKIFDYVIELYSETDTILDFEGSDMPGIARFFKGFGSREEEYTFLKWNKLPIIIKYFK